MPADTLTCQVTPDSVEPTSLSCSVPPLEWLDLWTMLGAWAAVAATLLLGLFALLAWRNSIATLAAMRSQEESAHDATQSQILSQQKLASEERLERAAMYSRESLATHISNWNSVAEVTNIDATPETVSVVLAKASTSGIIWRSHHNSYRSRLHHAARWEADIAEAVLYEADRITYGGIKWYNSRELVREISIYTELIMDWEADPMSRTDIENLFRVCRDLFLTENPTMLDIDRSRGQMKDLWGKVMGE